jgi:hypothetical protein
VPSKPRWFSRINDIIRELEALPRPFVDTATLEFLLGVGRRRAQQILIPCITTQVGSNGLADRAAVVALLRRLAAGDAVHYERRRRRRVADVLTALQNQPRLLVEAPVAVASQELENLPEGVHLAPGRITVSFDQPQQALEKLLALAMAISNDFDRFERSVTPPS